MDISFDGTIIHKVAGSTLAVNTTAYDDGDLVGTKMTLTDILPHGRGGLLETVTLHDLDAQDAALQLLIWDTNPSGTTFTNNSALDVADADLPNIIARIAIAATDYTDLADNSVGCVTQIAIPVKAAIQGILYAALVSDGATPTYSANGLSITFGLLVDP